MKGNQIILVEIREKERRETVSAKVILIIIDVRQR